MLKKLASSVVAVGLMTGGAMAVAVTPAAAANNCQHYSHWHYHFPYAHDDYHRYDGRSNLYNTHTHFYRNTTHSDNYSKNCGDPH